MAGPIFGEVAIKTQLSSGQVQYLVQSNCHFSWQAGAILGEVAVEFHAQFSSWQVQYLVQVTFRGRWQRSSSPTLSFCRGRCNIWCRSLFVAGAVPGDVAVSLVMTEAAFGEICIFCGQREK